MASPIICCRTISMCLHCCLEKMMLSGTDSGPHGKPLSTAELETFRLSQPQITTQQSLGLPWVPGHPAHLCSPTHAPHQLACQVNQEVLTLTHPPPACWLGGQESLLSSQVPEENGAPGLGELPGVAHSRLQPGSRKTPALHCAAQELQDGSHSLACSQIPQGWSSTPNSTIELHWYLPSLCVPDARPSTKDYSDSNSVSHTGTPNFSPPGQNASKPTQGGQECCKTEHRDSRVNGYEWPRGQT